MAKVLFGPIVSEARNKEGSVVFSRGPYGAYTRPWVEPDQTETAARHAAKDRMAAAAAAWNNSLTPAQRAAWEVFAKLLDYRDTFGARKNHSGRTPFLQQYLYLDNLGLATLTNPPPSTNRLSLKTAALTLNSDTATLILTLTWPAGQAQPPVIIYATPGLNAAVNFPGHRFRQIATLGSAVAYPYNLWALYTTVLPLPEAGQRVFTAARPIHPTTGLAGTKLTTSALDAGTGVPMYAKITTLTNAQIQALPTTAITIVPAVAGKLIVPVIVVLQLDAAAAAYGNISAGSGNHLYCNCAARQTCAQRNDAFLNAAVKRTCYLPARVALDAVPPTNAEQFHGASNDADIEGTDLTLNCVNAAGNFTLGNAANTLKVTTYYQLIDAI